MILKHFDTIRRTLSKQSNEEAVEKKKTKELDFLPAYLEIMERPPANVARLFIFSILLFCSITLVWSIIGKIDIIASSEGKLIVEQRSKTIQSIENGEVIEILVRDGQLVVEGDKLVKLNPVQAEAEAQRIKRQIIHANMELARLTALLSDNPILDFSPPSNADLDLVATARAYLFSEYHEQYSKIRTYRAQLKENRSRQHTTKKVITNVSALLNNVSERYNQFWKLAEQGNYPKLQLLEIEKEKLEQKLALEEQRNLLKQLTSEAQTLRAQKAQQNAEWRRTLLARAEEQKRSIIDYDQELIKAQETTRFQTIVAPVSGIVQESAIHTVGGVVTPGQNLMRIVPSNASLEVEVKVLNKDKGFVLSGQAVEVKVDSFPYTKYGTIKGVVLNVSSDSIEDEKLGLIYPAHIKLNQEFIYADGKLIPLTAGMRITAEIKTGDRRVIEYLLSPLQEYASKALKGR